MPTALLAWLQRYQWILWIALQLLVVTVLAVGFDFKTPAAQFRALNEKNAQQDTTIEALGRYVRALVVGQCLDRPPRETQLMGLDCPHLVSGKP
jgi:hypothetical protein